MKVLIVEDEPDLAEIYKIEFESSGAQVFHSDNLDMAFKIAKENQPDIIFLDLLLTQKEVIENKNSRSGYLLLEKLKDDDQTKSIDVVICSNLDTQQDRKESIKRGACEYVVKSEVVPHDLVCIACRIIKKT